MDHWTRRGFLGSLSGAAAATALGAQRGSGLPLPENRTRNGS
ncbi:MAG TPA: twin-arginine translocation signal domain-containing protein, partial [Terriglobia bacterium]|nr:twin-arginine translocation signal domain-containing protein [Terriglobia bacterium]